MTYSYKCINKECKKYNIEFDIDKSIKDTNIEMCEECGNEVKRVWKPITPIWNCNGNYNSTR